MRESTSGKSRSSYTTHAKNMATTGTEGARPTAKSPASIAGSAASAARKATSVWRSMSRPRRDRNLVMSS